MAELPQHAAFIASQGAPHPIIQQIDTLNSLYKPVQQVLLVDGDNPGQGVSKEIADDIGNLAQDSVNESIR